MRSRREGATWAAMRRGRGHLSERESVKIQREKGGMTPRKEECKKGGEVRPIGANDFENFTNFEH